MPFSEEQARLEERYAREWLLYREQANDLRNQFQNLFDLFCEQTGLSRDEATKTLAARVAENRAKE